MQRTTAVAARHGGGRRDARFFLWAQRRAVCLRSSDRNSNRGAFLSPTTSATTSSSTLHGSVRPLIQRRFLNLFEPDPELREEIETRSGYLTREERMNGTPEQRRREQQYDVKLKQMEEERRAGIVWRLSTGVVLERYPVLRYELYDWEKDWHNRWLQMRQLTARDEEKNLEIMEEWKHGAKKVTRKEKKVQKKEKMTERIEGHKAKAQKQQEDAAEGDDAAPPQQQQQQQQQKRRAGKEQQEDKQQEREEQKGKPRTVTYEEAKALVDELSPRITEADRANDRKSLERKLDHRYASRCAFAITLPFFSLSLLLFLSSPPLPSPLALALCASDTAHRMARSHCDPPHVGWCC